MKHIEEAIHFYITNGTVENIAVRVGKYDSVLHDAFGGNVDEHTVFDMASVTKMMVTTPLALIALDRGLLKLEDPVDQFYRTDKHITIKNLLTHTVGIGHKALNQSGNDYENIAEKILEIPLDIPTGTDVLYSCPGFILLGKILEKIFEEKLDRCFDKMVAKPLGLHESAFLPQNKQMIVNSNLSEEMRGTVNDYNCQFLGGVAGNAGLFSSLSDVTNYVSFLLNKGQPLISEKTFEAAVNNHTVGMSESRGLGFLYVDDRYKQTGGFFPEGAIGHCGHTGQSVFLDYRSGMYAIILSDATISTVKKYGRENYSEVMDMRAKLHEALKKDFS